MCRTGGLEDWRTGGSEAGGKEAIMEVVKLVQVRQDEGPD